jgi:hypothetical protein
VIIPFEEKGWQEAHETYWKGGQNL